MAAAQSAMLRDFPLLLPEDTTLSLYHGFVTVHGHDYRVRFALPAAPSDGAADGVAAAAAPGLAGAALHGPPELWALLEAHGALPMLEQRLVRSGSVHEFFVELRELVERLHRTAAAPSAGNGGAAAVLPLAMDAAVYARLVEEVSEIGWSKVTRVEEAGASELHLALELRVSGRAHALSVAFPGGYPSAPPRCAAALPAHVELAWSADPSSAAGGSRLKDIVAQYEQAMASYSDVWAELDVLDTEAWVIEPEAPTRANLHRRLALNDRSSVHVELDPKPGCARAVPEIRFLGSEAAVAPLRVNIMYFVSKTRNFAFETRKTFPFKMKNSACRSHSIGSCTPGHSRRPSSKTSGCAIFLLIFSFFFSFFLSFLLFFIGFPLKPEKLFHWCFHCFPKPKLNPEGCLGLHYCRMLGVTLPSAADARTAKVEPK